MLTAAEIAVAIGVSYGFIRRVVAENQIRPVGKRGRMHLYDAEEVTRHTGRHDRLAKTA